MTLQFHPLAFGVMLVVAAGTLAYTLWNSNRPSTHRPSSRRTFGDDRSYSDFDFDDRASTTTTKTVSGDERPSKRKRNADRCAICLGALKGSLKSLTCEHTFHDHCIQTWLVTNNTCPMCRRAPT